MDSIKNIWQHPRTTIAGLLIAIITVAGVFTQQGVSLGQAGSGTVISLISAVATALLGLLARDPQPTTSKNTSATLGVWAMIFLLVQSPWMTGCSTASVARQIVNWTPALQTAVATVDSTVSLLAPADAPILATATAGFDAASNLLVTQAKAYLANPNATLLSQLQNQIVVLEQQVNTSLLASAKIVDPASQKQALNVLNGVMAITGAILALIQSVSSPAAKAQMASQATVKISAIEPLLNKDQIAEIVASHTFTTFATARRQIDKYETEAIETGL